MGVGDQEILAGQLLKDKELSPRRRFRASFY